jgi:hypothetical protein
MWKTGKESWPSATPREERITLMKWMQVFCNRGAEEAFVRSWRVSNAWKESESGSTEATHLYIHSRYVANHIHVVVDNS